MQGGLGLYDWGNQLNQLWSEKDHLLQMEVVERVQKWTTKHKLYQFHKLLAPQMWQLFDEQQLEFDHVAIVQVPCAWWNVELLHHHGSHGVHLWDCDEG